ncbi:MAG: hypothetical protein V3W41_20690 [Planctomycetota bacterium]
MSRFFRQFAILTTSMALFFCAAGADVLAGTSYGPRLTLRSGAPVIGQSIDMEFSGPNPFNGCTVRLYVGDPTVGTTTVTVNGQSVVLPIANASQFDTGTFSNGRYRSAYTLPIDKTLIGTQKYFIAVIEVGTSIKTSLVMPSGPILGDDIA